jgi:uncharacterized protein YigE (DUF2233 family)
MAENAIFFVEGRAVCAGFSGGGIFAGAGEDKQGETKSDDLFIHRLMFGNHINRWVKLRKRWDGVGKGEGGNCDFSISAIYVNRFHVFREYT